MSTPWRTLQRAVSTFLSTPCAQECAHYTQECVRHGFQQRYEVSQTGAECHTRCNIPPGAPSATLDSTQVFRERRPPCFGWTHVDEPTAQPMQGKYTNYFEIRYTPTEFLFDFGEHYPESEPPLRHTRIVTSADSALVLADMLREALRRHQQELERAGQEES